MAVRVLDPLDPTVVQGIACRYKCASIQQVDDNLRGLAAWRDSELEKVGTAIPAMRPVVRKRIWSRYRHDVDLLLDRRRWLEMAPIETKAG